MITKAQIAEAMRNTDAISEEHQDMPRYWRQRGVDLDGLMHGAMQHGLRQVMIMKGMSPNVREATPVGLTAAENDMVIKFAGAFLCGFAAAEWAIRENDDSKP